MAGATTQGECRRYEGGGGLSPPPDKDVELTLSCRGVTWLVPWLLPFGDGARVLEPDSLVRAVEDACRAILAECG